MSGKTPTPKDHAPNEKAPSSHTDEATDAPKDEEERIDHSVDESFPASDPPATHNITKI